MCRRDLQETRVAEHVVSVASSRSTASIDVAPLRMIEHIERFRTELEPYGLRDTEVFEQCHIEVCTPGVAENVSADVSESEPARRCKSICVVEHLGTQTRIGGRERSGMWIANQVWACTSTGHRIRHACVVHIEERAERSPRRNAYNA